jgi:hypothetical protein
MGVAVLFSSSRCLVLLCSGQQLRVAHVVGCAKPKHGRMNAISIPAGAVGGGGA